MPVIRVSPSVAIVGVPGVAVLAVLAVAGLLAGGVIGGSDHRVDGAVPGTLTVEGVHLTLDAQVPVVSVTPAPGDPSGVVVDVGQIDADAACGGYAAVRVTEQDDQRVRLAAYGYRADDGAAPGACTDPGFAGHVTVDLGSPLDGRGVVEEGTDRVLVPAG